MRLNRQEHLGYLKYRNYLKYSQCNRSHVWDHTRFLEPNAYKITNRFEVLLPQVLFIIVGIFVLCSICTLLGVKGGMAKTFTREERTPNLYDTLRVIKHPQGVKQALLYLESLSNIELQRLKSAPLSKALTIVACSLSDQVPSQGSNAEISSSKLDVENSLKAIFTLTRLGISPPCLRERWLLPSVNAHLKKEVSYSVGDAPIDLLARASALNFRQLGRVDLLQGLSGHQDPEVREHTAYAGSNPDQLCDLLSDPWVNVRFAAIRGIEKLSSPEGLCLVELLKSSDRHLKLRSMRALGQLSRADWAKDYQAPPHLRDRLNEVYQSPNISLELRQAALLTLALWGNAQPARQVLNEHFESGGLLELTRGALKALTLSRASRVKDLVEKILVGDFDIELKLDALASLTDPRVHWDEHTPPFVSEERLTLLKGLLKSGPHHILFERRIHKAIENLSLNHLNDRKFELPPFNEEDL